MMGDTRAAAACHPVDPGRAALYPESWHWSGLSGCIPEVDPLLGPEMRSTGEVLGLADSFGMAFYKAEEAAKQTLPEKGTVLITVAVKDQAGVLGVARQFAELGFEIKATRGTHQFLTENGMKTDLS